MSKSHAHLTPRATKSAAKPDDAKAAKSPAHKSSLAAKAAKAAQQKPAGKSEKSDSVTAKSSKKPAPSAKLKKATAKSTADKPTTAKKATTKAKTESPRSKAAEPEARPSPPRQQEAGTLPASQGQNQEAKSVISKSTAAATKAAPAAAEAAPTAVTPAATSSEAASARKLSLAFSQPAPQTVSGQVSTAGASGHAPLEGASRAFRDDPLLDKRIIEGMLDDKEGFLDDMHAEGFSREAVIRRAAELGLSEALIRQVKGVAADLAGERPGKRPTPNSLGARTCLQCDRVFFSSGPGNRLCTRCRGGDAGLAQL